MKRSERPRYAHRLLSLLERGASDLAPGLAYVSSAVMTNPARLAGELAVANACCAPHTGRVANDHCDHNLPTNANLDGWSGDGLLRLTGASVEVCANWKLVLAGFCETDHFPTVHRNTLNLLVPPGITAFDRCGQNFRLGIPLFGLDRWRALEADGQDPFGFFTLLYFRFPNQILSVGRDAVHIFTVTPGPSMDRCRVDHACFVTRTAIRDTSHRATLLASSDEVWATVCDEDFPMVERVQANLNAAPDFDMVCSRREPGVIALLATLLDATEGGPKLRLDANWPLGSTPAQWSADLHLAA